MKKPAGLLTLAWVLVLWGIWSCTGNEGLPGRYRTELQGEDPPRSATLELNENGQGTWKISGDQVTFKWEVRGKEIRLHTREGGVVTGSREDNAIHLRLPGMPPLTFRRPAR
ncbi:MAG: hypothetical protein HY892_04880 [Deltaproteobacteria bacterium]|nr:hypothetical protein [Deltaproteobacteria bacterium]